MDEYVLDDGRIKIGPNCVGAVEFVDGHYEPIINLDFITMTHFHFITASGLYSYKEGMEPDEFLYCDPNPHVHYHFRHEFTKYDYDLEKWLCIDTMTRVYVYKPAYSSVFNKEEV